MLSLEDGKRLIGLARDAISSVFKRIELKVDEKFKEEYNEKKGVFVTLKEDGELRGCIGFPEPVHEMWKAVVEAARAAAFGDPRFPPLKKEEEIQIELSVLTKPERVKVKNPEEYLKKIRIGKDGLIIRAGVFSGLLLPIVAVEYDWNAEQFLRHVCMKAGLTMDAWRTPSHQIYKFQTQVFAEENGRIVEKMG